MIFPRQSSVSLRLKVKIKICAFRDFEDLYQKGLFVPLDFCISFPKLSKLIVRFHILLTNAPDSGQFPVLSVLWHSLLIKWQELTRAEHSLNVTD